MVHEADGEAINAQVRQAFAFVTYPGPGRLTEHATVGDEEYLTREAFRNCTDWRMLDSSFLDEAPDGYASALAFFTPEAFRFYLPAYLLADLDRRLQRVSPCFHLSYGLSDADRSRPQGRNARVELQRHGGQTRFERRSRRYAVFAPAERGAIVAYLRYKLHDAALEQPTRARVGEALRNYWLTGVDAGS